MCSAIRKNSLNYNYSLTDSQMMTDVLYESGLTVGGFVFLCTHQIPGLMSLKRHSSVVFVGIDTLDDIRNNSYNELFVSGGCIVSDELLLNPDFISPGRSRITIQQQHPAKCFLS